MSGILLLEVDTEEPTALPTLPVSTTVPVIEEPSSLSAGFFFFIVLCLAGVAYALYRKGRLSPTSLPESHMKPLIVMSDATTWGIEQDNDDEIILSRDSDCNQTRENSA